MLIQGTARLAGDLQTKQAAAQRFNKAALEMSAHTQQPVNALYRIPEEGVALRRELMTKNGETKPVYFTNFDRVPMGDWDFPDPIHPASSVNIDNLGDVYDRLNRFTHDNPGSRFKVYLTPGGVRAFDLTNPYTPQQYADSGFFEQLKVDPNYERFSLNRRLQLPQKPFLSNSAWASRVSGKPSRPEDFVAFPIDVLGKGLPNPENQRLITTYHDIPITRAITKEGLTPGMLPESGMNLLAQQIKSLDRQDASSVRARLAGLGIHL